MNNIGDPRTRSGRGRLPELYWRGRRIGEGGVGEGPKEEGEPTLCVESESGVKFIIALNRCEPLTPYLCIFTPKNYP